MSGSEISDEHLFKAGFGAVPHAKTAPRAHAYLNELDCVRVALRLMAGEQATIGLLPLSRMGNGRELSERLSRAIAERDRGNVALLRLTDGESTQNCRSADPLELGAQVRGRWLAPTLLLIEPASKFPPENGLAVLEGLVRYARARVSRVVVDLSSLAEADMRQALAACHLLDGVGLLAVAGVTREGELLAVRRELGEGRNLGALLLSPVPS
jgi:hypothetical protein